MHVPEAFGVFLIGAGIGALVVWFQQTASRRLLQDLEEELDRICFGRARRERLANEQRIAAKEASLASAPPELVSPRRDCQQMTEIRPLALATQSKAHFDKPLWP